jgi:hypothetical protein
MAIFPKSSRTFVIDEGRDNLPKKFGRRNRMIASEGLALWL